MASKEKLRQLIAESVKNVLSDIFEETDKQRASRVLKALGGTLVNADKINHEELGAKLGISAIAVRRAIRDIREEQGMAEIRNKIKENFFVWNPSSKEEKTAFFEEVAEQVTSLIKDFFSSNEIIGNLFGPVKNVQINKVIHQDKFNLEFIIKFTSKQNPKINFSLIHMGTTTPSYMIFIETKSNNTKSNSLTWESESFDIIDTNVSKHIEPVLNNFLKYVLSTKEITQNLTKILGYIAKTISNKKLLHSNQGVDSNITLPNPIFRIENRRAGENE
jgi:DNA-binding transcriptional regulator YhcF (GntR family)